MLEALNSDQCSNRCIEECTGSSFELNTNMEQLDPGIECKDPVVMEEALKTINLHGDRWEECYLLEDVVTRSYDVRFGWIYELISRQKLFPSADLVDLNTETICQEKVTKDFVWIHLRVDSKGSVYLTRDVSYGFVEILGVLGKRYYFW